MTAVLGIPVLFYPDRIEPVDLPSETAVHLIHLLRRFDDLYGEPGWQEFWEELTHVERVALIMTVRAASGEFARPYSWERQTAAVCSLATALCMLAMVPPIDPEVHLALWAAIRRWENEHFDVERVLAHCRIFCPTELRLIDERVSVAAVLTLIKGGCLDIRDTLMDAVGVASGMSVGEADRSLVQAVNEVARCVGWSVTETCENAIRLHWMIPARHLANRCLASLNKMEPHSPP